MMESSIVEFYRGFYIPDIHKLTFHLTHVSIIVIHHCGNMRQEVFQCHSAFQDVLCHSDYAERVVAIFIQQIKY